MNTAMHIMSIQHQLVLAIGKSADIKEMLHQFLHLCSLTLNSTNCHIFLLQDKTNKPTYLQDKDAQTQLKHLLSFPMKKNGELSSKNKSLANLADQFFHANHVIQIIDSESSLYHFFNIGDFGVLAIERKQYLGSEIQNALTPVLKKLAISCIASMDHSSLILEIKNRQQVEEKMRYQASHDFLTGLYNRMRMQECLAKTIDSCVKQQKTGAILLINLVKFKNINDVLGYHVGDKVLRQVAMRLKNTVKNIATVGRFDGHQFIVLLNELPSASATNESVIDSIVSELIDAIEIPLELSEGQFSLSCFIGYETFNDTSKGVQDILKNASIAMYEAFKRGKNKALAYDNIMLQQLNDHISYTHEIKNALKNNEFELYYQPQFDQLNNIIGAEALLRWNNPLRGYESPAVYIPIAEESDLIIQISHFVLQQACKDIKKLEQLSLPGSFKQVSINISAKQLAKHNFVETITSAIEESKISPAHLKIEITESVMMGDIDLAIACLEQLQQFGVECAIDDFGTGYSSLIYLKRLPANLLKIDRFFVTDIHKNKSNYAIANMIIELAKSLNMEVIAEGVETKQELNCLIELGCNQYQGYYFSHALPFNKLLGYFNKETSVALYKSTCI